MHTLFPDVTSSTPLVLSMPNSSLTQPLLSTMSSSSRDPLYDIKVFLYCGCCNQFSSPSIDFKSLGDTLIEDAAYICDHCGTAHGGQRGNTPIDDSCNQDMPSIHVVSKANEEAHNAGITTTSRLPEPSTYKYRLYFFMPVQLCSSCEAVRSNACSLVNADFEIHGFGDDDTGPVWNEEGECPECGMASNEKNISAFRVYLYEWDTAEGGRWRPYGSHFDFDDEAVILMNADNVDEADMKFRRSAWDELGPTWLDPIDMEEEMGKVEHLKDVNPLPGEPCLRIPLEPWSVRCVFDCYVCNHLTTKTIRKDGNNDDDIDDDWVFDCAKCKHPHGVINASARAFLGHRIPKSTLKCETFPNPHACSTCCTYQFTPVLVCSSCECLAGRIEDLFEISPYFPEGTDEWGPRWKGECPQCHMQADASWRTMFRVTAEKWTKKGGSWGWSWEKYSPYSNGPSLLVDEVEVTDELREKF